MPPDRLSMNTRRFVVREVEDDEALEVIDASNGANVVVCTCWQEPGFAHDIARLLNSDPEAISDAS